MLNLSTKLIVLRTVLFLAPVSAVSTLLSNSSVLSRRSTDGFSETNILNRQYPGWTDATFLLPHLIVGVFIPIAVIIGIGVVLMKLFIIGFMLLGRGGYGYGMAQNFGGIPPWRADQQHPIHRSLRSKDGLIPSYLSATIWQIIDKFSKSIDKYQ